MEQVIIGGHGNTVVNTTTRYNAIFSGALWSNSEGEMQQVISTGGKIKNLFVELDGTPGAGKSYKLTVRINGSSVGTPTTTIADSATTNSDTSTEKVVSAGDLIAIECDPTGTPTARRIRWSIVFEGDTANESLLLSSQIDTPHQTNTEYNRVTGRATWSTTESNFRQVCPTSGVIKNLYVDLRTDPGTSPDAYEFTLRVNGADSDDGGNPLQVTIVADNTTGNDTAQNIIVSAGDILTMKCVPISTPATNVNARWGMTFVADTNGESIIMGAPSSTLDNAATNFVTLADPAGWTATESEQLQLAQACTLKKLYVLLNGSPGSSNNYTFTVRLEEASPGSGLVVTISGAATTGNDVSNDITVLDSNMLGLMCVPFSTPTVRNAYWGLVSFIEPVVIPPPVGGSPLAQMIQAGLV